MGIHRPKNLNEADLAGRRLIFDEFFYLQVIFILIVGGNCQYYFQNRFPPLAFPFMPGLHVSRAPLVLPVE